MQFPQNIGTLLGSPVHVCVLMDLIPVCGGNIGGNLLHPGSPQGMQRGRAGGVAQCSCDSQLKRSLEGERRFFGVVEGCRELMSVADKA